MSADALAVLASLVGYRLGEQTRVLLDRALSRTADALGVAREEAVQRLVEKSPEAWMPFCASVAIHETYFFRHPEHFTLLERHAREAAAAGRPLQTAWSVGCATGEEAWSLALTLSPWTPTLQVAGSDLSEAALEVARRGRYPARALREEVGAPLRSGLLPVDGGFVVSERLRRQVAFAPLNLATGPVSPPAPLPAAVDVIFCRNVLVYLSPQLGAQGVEALAAHLSPNGLLVLGPVDTGDFVPSSLEPVDPAMPGVFRRRPVHGRSPAPARLHQWPTEPCESAPDDQRLLASARALADGGHFDEALAALERAPASAYAAYLAASIQLERGCTSEASALLHRAVQLQEDHAAAHLQLALLAHQRADRAALARHRDRVERLLQGRADDERLEPGTEGMRVRFARDLLQSLSLEEAS